MTEQGQDQSLPEDGTQLDLEKEVIPAKREEGQSMAGNNVPKGFIFTEDEELKRFYLKLAMVMCPSVTSESTENEALFKLYTRIKKSRRLLALLDNYSWVDGGALITKACCFMMMDNTVTSLQEKRKLNNLLFERTTFVSKIMKLNDLIAHDLTFFAQIKKNLETMLHIQPTDQENQDNEGI